MGRFVWWGCSQSEAAISVCACVFCRVGYRVSGLGAFISISRPFIVPFLSSCLNSVVEFLVNTSELIAVNLKFEKRESVSVEGEKERKREEKRAREKRNERVGRSGRVARGAQQRRLDGQSSYKGRERMTAALVCV